MHGLVRIVILLLGFATYNAEPAPLFYDEFTVSGDLPAFPSDKILSFSEGLNVVRGTMFREDFDADFDSFNFTIPHGMQLVQAFYIAPAQIQQKFEVVEPNFDVHNVPARHVLSASVVDLFGTSPVALFRG